MVSGHPITISQYENMASLCPTHPDSQTKEIYSYFYKHLTSYLTLSSPGHRSISLVQPHLPTPDLVTSRKEKEASISCAGKCPSDFFQPPAGVTCIHTLAITHSGQLVEVLTRPTGEESSRLSQSNASSFWKTSNCSSPSHPQSSNTAQLSICGDHKGKRK